MRKSGIVLMSFAASLLATAAIAQGMSGNTGMTSPAAKAAGADGGSTMGGSMTGPSNMDGANAFSKEDMIMMIVERDRSTQGMNDEQKKAARAQEMQLHGHETPQQRVDRKNAYAAGWAKLSAADKDKYSAMYAEQQRQRATAAAGAAGGATPNGGMGANMGAMPATGGAK